MPQHSCNFCTWSAIFSTGTEPVTFQLGSCAGQRLVRAVVNLRGILRLSSCPSILSFRDENEVAALLQVSHKPRQNFPKSPCVARSTSCSRLFPYLRLYSDFTLMRCVRSQCSRTSLLIRSSYRNSISLLRLLISSMAWCRRRESRAGRLITPLRMCAITSPLDMLAPRNIFGRLPTMKTNH